MSAREKEMLSGKSRASSGRSSLRGKVEEAWETGTVTTVTGRLSSDESDFTLKDLGLSSSGSELVESTESSSEDETYIKRYLKRSDSPKKRVNVFVPNLELSLQSARDEFKAERQRITNDTDWTCISLDDRTNRSSVSSQDLNSSLTKDESLKFDTNLRLSSSLSSRNVTPAIDDLDKSLTLNESARSRRRDKCKDLPRYSEEFFMRESFDNRRPSSPKKRVSLTKKLRESSGKSTPTITDSFQSEEFVNTETDTVKTLSSLRSSHTDTLKGGGSVNASQDSFFGLLNGGVKAVIKEAKHGFSKTDNKNDIVDKSVDKKEAETGMSVTSTDIASSVSKDIARSLNSGRSVTKVMEFDAKNNVDVIKDIAKSDDLLSIRKNDRRTQTQRRDSGRLSSSRKDSFDKSLASYLNDEQDFKPQTPKKLNASLFSDVSEINTDLEASTYLDKRIEKTSVDKSVDEVNVQRSSDKSVKDQMRESIKKDFRLVLADLTESVPKSPTVVNDGSKAKSQITQPVPKETSAKPGQVEQPMKETSAKPRQVEQPMKETSAKPRQVEQPMKETSAKPRQVKQPMKETSAKPGQVEQPMKETSAKPGQVKQPMNQNRRTPEKEEIRVKLNVEEVEKKQRPTITPRRSKLNKSRNLEANITEREKGENPIRVSLKMMESQALNTSLQNESKNSGTPRNEKDDFERTLEAMTMDESVKKHDKDQKSVRDKPEEKISANSISSPKKRTISVKLRKDPLASTKEPTPRPSRQSASPVPPAPPPPPLLLSSSVTMVARSVQDTVPRTSMADELKSRLAVRQSISEGVRVPDRNLGQRSMFSPVPGNRQHRKQPMATGSESIAKSGLGLVDITEMDEKLAPKQSDGLPAFMVQSLDLLDQKDHLRSITRPHRNQMDDLSNASQEQLSSIADILKKV